MEDTHGQYEESGAGVDNSDSEYEPTDTLPFVTDSAAVPSDSRKSTPLNPEIRSVNTASTPATTGRKAVSTGFLVEHDDEDNDDDASSEHAPGTGDGQSGVSSATGVSQRSATQTPIQNVSTSNVLIHNAAPEKGEIPDSASVHVPSSFDTAQASNTAKSSHTLPIQQGKAPSSFPLHALPKARLPHDVIGILEDRIKEDPRGDMEAWLGLISEHRRRNKFDDAQQVYERFFKVFPSAAEQWVSYAYMELQNNDFYRLEQIFNSTLLKVPNVQLWSIYLDYIRRRNNLTTDVDGSARKIINQAYDFALQQIGIDKDSAQIWQDYVQFIRTGPGAVGGTSWQDQQKVDTLRKTYQRAICVPTQAVNGLWKEYDTFEMGLNKMTGRKFLQEKSPSYMTARSSYTELQNITKDLNRTTLPRLPPALGFDGDVEYTKQLDIWRRWIQWEKDDPLVLKDEDLKAYQDRVIYVYKQALMALKFWPEMWFEASEFSFQQGLDNDGNEFLLQGTASNPESCLLAFKRADRLESTTSNEGGSEGIKTRAASVREPYDKVLEALYDLITKAKAREATDVARVEASWAGSNHKVPGALDEDDEEDSGNAATEKRLAEKNSQIDAIKTGNTVQIQLLSKTISFAWVGLMRAMRRIGGKGSPGDMPGCRQIFSDARKRGRLTSDVYVANALIEYHCYKDPAATKIFERGMKLFPEDENFALEFLKHLIAINDITNARAVFETTVSKLTSKPENVQKSKVIFAFLHEYESHYGELSQVIKLEKRMADLFPDDPMLRLFSHRYSAPGFDPTAIRPVISPSQSKPKFMSSIEPFSSVSDSPAPPYLEVTNSPKRPFPQDDFDDDRPRKLPRGESPLKGAAGKRLEQQRRLQANGGTTGQGHLTPQGMIPPLPRDVMMLLSLIPSAKYYTVERFNPEKMVELLQRTDIPVPQRAQSASTPSMNLVGGTPMQQGGSIGPGAQYPNSQTLPNSQYSQYSYGAPPPQAAPGSWNYR